MSSANHAHLVQLEYVDYTNYYMIYNITALIVILLLLWSFVRPRQQPDFGYALEGMTTDAKYRYGPLQKGTYGDVTVYFNETPDNQFANEWRTKHGGIYLHNNRTRWRDVNTPDESDFWNKQGDPILGVPEKWQKTYSPVRDIVQW